MFNEVSSPMAAPRWLPNCRKRSRGRRSVQRRFGGDFAEHFSNPGAPDTIPHAFSIAVLKLAAHAKAKELLDDLSLSVYCHCRARSTAAGVLHGQMKWSGPGFVFQGWVAAGSQQTLHRGSTTGSDGAVSRRSKYAPGQMSC